MPAEADGAAAAAASDQPAGEEGASAAAPPSPGGRSDSPTRKKKKKKKPAPKKPAAKGKGDDADAAADAADPSSVKRSGEEEEEEAAKEGAEKEDKAEEGSKEGEEDAAAAAEPSEGVVAAAVSAALSALASASPEPASVPFLLQVSASFATAGAHDGVQAYAVVSFGGRTADRRTSTQAVRGRRGVAWDGEWLPAAAAAEGCRVCVQVLTDEGTGVDGSPRLLLGTEHVVRRAAVLRCRTVDKVWGLPCGDLGTIRLTCRAGTAADAATAAGGDGGHHPPAVGSSGAGAAARGGTAAAAAAAPLGEAPGSRERGAAGRRLFAFFRAHGGEARLRGIPAMLNAYAGREGDLIEAHKLAHPWWDWDRDPVEVGDWARRIVPRHPHVFAAEPVSQEEAYGRRPRAKAAAQQQQHNSPKVI